jgi:predicted nucleic acid-binding Zn ribbon protein
MSRWADTVLAEWRRYREPQDLAARTTGVLDALRLLLPKLGLGDAMDEQAVRRAWVAIVGPFIASQSQPDRIRGGVLYVRVHQSSVRFELERTWKAEIARKLAAEFGKAKIRDVKFFG